MTRVVIALAAALAATALFAAVEPTMRGAVGAHRGHDDLVARLRPLLVRAGVDLPVGRALMAVVAAAGVAAAAALRLTGSVPLTLAAAASVPVAAAIHLRARLRRYPDRVAAQLPGVTRGLADGLRAGLSLRQALARAARDLPAPAQQEFAQVADDLEHGARADDALEALAARIPHPDVDVTVCAVLVTSRGGGDLARILTDLAASLEDRRRTAAELATATAQARMTAWLVAALPVVAGVAVEAFAPGTLGSTLGSGIGRAAAIASATLFTLAIVLVRRLSRVTA